MITAISKILNAGVDQAPTKTLARKIGLTNVLGLSVFLGLSFFSGLILFEGERFTSFVIFSCGLVYFLVIALNLRGLFKLSRFIFILAGNAIIFIVSNMLGEESGAHFAIFLVFIGPTYLIDKNETFYLVVCLLLAPFNFFLIHYYDFGLLTTINFSSEDYTVIYTVSVALTFVLAIIFNFALLADARKVEEDLEHTVAQLKEKEQLLIEQNVELQEKTNELIEMQSELQTNQVSLFESKEKAEKALKVKSEFLSNVSHEVRTPLNVILGLTELVLKEPLPEKDLENLKYIKNSADNLLSVINDILDFSKLEEGKLKLAEETFDLKTYLDDLGRVLIVRANNKGLEARVKVGENIPRIAVGDRLRLNQALTNVIDNALKFTKKGYIALDVSARYKDSERFELRVNILDTGIGIHQSKLNQIFNSFSQAYASITRQFGGTGLGLAISKKLVKLMNGDIQLSSQIDQGSEFVITAEMSVGKESKLNLVPEFEAGSALQGKIVLVAEDFEMNQIFLSQLLSSWGVEVEFASHGMEAVDLAMMKKYDLILMDLQMPHLSGYDACREIRNVKNLSPNVTTPIIAVTADAFEKTRLKVLQAGMDDFVTKPVQRSDLYKKMENAIG